MPVDQAYIEAFKRCYPEKDVQVKYRYKRNGYQVIINGDSGDMILSEDDMRSATRMLNR